HAGQGSMDFVGACRSAWLAAIDPSDPSSRVLAHYKSNVSALGPSWRYGFSAEGRFEWRGISPLRAGDLTARRKGERGPGADKIEDAKSWLILRLGSSGPRLANEIATEAKDAGISERTLKRAKGELGVQSKKAGTAWLWELRPSDTAAA